MLDADVRAALQKRKRHVLPSGAEVVDIYGSVGGGYMMAFDGRLFEGDLDVEEREVTDPVRVRLALVLGSKAIPELERLIPQRPQQAVDYTDCQGTGRSAVSDEVTWACNPCGGVGWREAP